MNLFETIQLSVVSSSILAFLISAIGCISFIKFYSSFKNKTKNQKRLNSLNIIPLGGVSMAFSFFLSVRFLGEASSKFAFISFFALSIAFVGVIDDFLNLNWKTKILFQFLFVGIPVLNLNIFINIENILQINLDNNLNFFFTICWVILLMNSVNFTDNMDGFAALNTAFIALGLGIISFIFKQNYLADISLILFFAIIGFFIFNYPPAKIYMGDSGSLFIGYVLGFISILFDWNPLNQGSIYDSFAPVLLFFTIPLLDFTTVFTHRLKNNISPTTGGTDHISHRLLKSGLSVKRVLFVFFSINCIVFAMLSASIFFNDLTIYLISIYILFIAFMFIKFYKMEVLD